MTEEDLDKELCLGVADGSDTWQCVELDINEYGTCSDLILMLDNTYKISLASKTPKH